MNPASTAPAHSAIKVLAALADLGEATAADVAEHAGLGYSTTTPKLRAWEASGQAERVRTDDGRTLWRLTAAGRAATATRPGPAGDQPHPVPSPTSSDQQPDRDGAPEPTHGAASVQPPAGPVTSTGGDPSLDPVTASEVTPNPAAESAVTTTSEPVGTIADSAVPDPDVAGGVTPEGTADTAAAPCIDAPVDGPPAPYDRAAGAAGADAGGAQAQPAAEATGRRTAGSLRGAILDVLHTHPGQHYKISELCRLIDAANPGTDARKASAGAVHNAAMKLVQTGAAVLAIEKPATFALAEDAA